ncbi:FxsA family protein [Shewanella livingstonensis]|uniref:FxsA family protein n=1 Tax=Shewanella livingstonensis TaxID=150120 RepID=A0A3G8LYZ8_9GAMM|nr:FxsA family protein [Shewanella livingstonensis]AZG74906.1 FxsA family protein [Shewanella livingstonensis]
MFFILLLIFVLVPVIELNVLIEVASSIGSWTTVGLVLFTAVVGVSLVRSQGLSTLMSVQQKLARGEAPGQEIVEGMMLAAAGVLLLIPGFVTDFIGLILLTPFTRAPIAAFLYKRMQLRVVANGGFKAGFGGGQSPFGQSGPFAGQKPFDQQGNTFDGDFEHKKDRPRSHQIEHDNLDADLDKNQHQGKQATSKQDKNDNIIDVEPVKSKDDHKPS